MIQTKRKAERNYLADLLLAIRASKMPEPRLEYVFGQSFNRAWRFDAAWPEANPPVALEYEGGTWAGTSAHMHPVAYREDCVKYSAAASIGWCVVRCTSDMVRDGTALALLRCALGLLQVSEVKLDPPKRKARKLTRLETKGYVGTGQPSGHKYPKTRKNLPPHVEAAVARARKP